MTFPPLQGPAIERLKISWSARHVPMIARPAMDRPRERQAGVVHIEWNCHIEEGSTMKWYQLYVRGDGLWELLCGIYSDSHITAFQAAMALLDERHANLPIRLEQDCEAPQVLPLVDYALA